jgi:hypothetical protein
VGSFSMPLVPGTNVVPSADGGGTFDFYNPTTMSITLADFATNIGQDLPLPSESTFSDGVGTLGPYTCLSGDFFTQCSFTYDSQTGVLGIDFITTNFGTGLRTGIPPLPSGCLPPPSGIQDTEPCLSSGHLTIDLNTDNDHTGDTGGWTPGDEITTTEVAVGPNYTPIPEPSLTWLLGAGCALLLGLARRRRAVSR